MAQQSEIITNQEFLTTYKLYLADNNQKFKSNKASWEHITEVLTLLKIKFCPQPTSKVRTFLSLSVPSIHNQGMNNRLIKSKLV